MRSIGISLTLVLLCSNLQWKAMADDAVNTVDANSTAGECSLLYSDAEARGLMKAAEKAVPVGKNRKKSQVLNALKIDPKRLCNRRVVGLNMSFQEYWHFSKSFDLKWTALLDDGGPMEKHDRRIAWVRIAPRTQAPTESSEGLSLYTGVGAMPAPRPAVNGERTVAPKEENGATSNGKGIKR